MIGVKGLKEIHFDAGEFRKKAIPALLKTMRDTVTGSLDTKLYNNRTGLLRKSSRAKGIKRSPTGMIATLINTAPYSAFIHNGTKKIHPRPFLAESLAPQMPQLMENLGDATVKALIHSRHRS
jgi:hypothetical protein